MCAPGCQKALESAEKKSVSEDFTKFAQDHESDGSGNGSTSSINPIQRVHRCSFSRVVDLTHTLTSEFPSFSGDKGFDSRDVASYKGHGYSIRQWDLNEHIGTHMDAPAHFFADLHSTAQIPVSDLFLPLAIISIASKAEENPDSFLTTEDILAWESAHGPVPDGGCVAMYSGWERYVHSARFRNADEKGTLHFPGFHEEAVQFLLEERNIRGLIVDTLSLDYGPSKNFGAHLRWLRANRWCIENAAQLSFLPPIGSTVVVGAPKVSQAGGGLTRLMALLE